MSVGWVAAGAAVVGTAASYKASKDATEAQEKASKEALDQAKSEFDTQIQLAEDAYKQLMGESDEEYGKRLTQSVIANEAAPTRNTGLIGSAFDEAKQLTIEGGLQTKNWLTDSKNFTQDILHMGKSETYGLLLGAGDAVTEGYAAGQDFLSSARGDVISGYNQSQAYLDTAMAKVEQAKAQFGSVDASGLGDAAIATLGSAMQEWDATFGPVLDNLSQFYQELTPQKMIGDQLTIQAQEFQQVKDALSKSFAQRGIVAGAQQSLTMQAELQNARERSTIRRDAPMQLAAAQQGFLAQSGAMQNPYTNQLASAQLAKDQMNLSAQTTNAQLGQNWANLEANIAGQQATLAAQQGTALADLTGQQASLAVQEGGAMANLFNTAAGYATQYAGQQANIESAYGQQMANLYQGTYDKLAALGLGQLDAETEALKLKTLQASQASSNLSNTTQAAIAAQGQASAAASSAQASAFGDLTAAGLTLAGKYWDNNNTNTGG